MIAEDTREESEKETEAEKKNEGPTDHCVERVWGEHSKSEQADVIGW